MDSISVWTFFGYHLKFDRKTVSIWLQTDQNLGQDRLMLFPASKKAPPPHCKFLATRLPLSWVFNGFDIVAANFLAMQGATGVEGL